MKPIKIYHVKDWENDLNIGYIEYHFWGFIGNKNGFTNRFLSSTLPFSHNTSAWHIFGLRFTKTPVYVSKTKQEINGWYTADKSLVEKLRKR